MKITYIEIQGFKKITTAMGLHISNQIDAVKGPFRNAHKQIKEKTKQQQQPVDEDEDVEQPSTQAGTSMPLDFLQ